MSTHTTMTDVHSHQTPRYPRSHRFSRNPFRRRRRHHPAMTPDSPNDLPYQPKPIYIYPGLLRIVRDKAIALDNQCPAVHYKCRECRNEPKLPHRPPCSHQTSCTICLDDFHSKDLVRRLPCNVNHVFHSKCILDWFITQHRCPLCNEPVSNNKPPRKHTHPGDHRVSSTGLHTTPADPPFSDLRRARSFRTVPTFTMDRSREARLPPQERRLSDLQRERSSPSSGSAEVPAIEQTCQDESERPPKAPQAEKGRKKTRGARRYSYIVHDNVRMEMNPVIPV